MIRRDVLHNDRSQRGVKWALLAASLALSLGLYAQASLETPPEDAASVVDVQKADTAPAALRG